MARNYKKYLVCSVPTQISTQACITESQQAKQVANGIPTGYCLLQNLPGKQGQQNAICWNPLGLFRDYGLNHILQHLFEKEFRETSQNFNSFSSFRQFLFPFSSIRHLIEQILKISAFYLGKQKSQAVVSKQHSAESPLKNTN